ncbi:MAG: toprim domain-containing protein [Archaeoglobaceae archaeon]
MIESQDLLKLEETFKELRRRSENGAVIIVEGPKDVASLRSLGIKGDIVTTCNTPDAVLVDEIGKKDVIILTDCDWRGDTMEKNLLNKFSSWGVTPNTEFKRRIFSVLKEIHEIEDLAKYLEKAREEVNLRNSSY